MRIRYKIGDVIITKDKQEAVLEERAGNGEWFFSINGERFFMQLTIGYIKNLKFYADGRPNLLYVPGYKTLTTDKKPVVLTKYAGGRRWEISIDGEPVDGTVYMEDIHWCTKEELMNGLRKYRRYDVGKKANKVYKKNLTFYDTYDTEDDNDEEEDWEDEAEAEEAERWENEQAELAEWENEQEEVEYESCLFINGVMISHGDPIKKRKKPEKERLKRRKEV
jgi:hypothetical protein